MEKKPSQLNINRRQAVQLGLGSIAGISALGATEARAETPKKRLAVIGGGMGGIASAYFCDSAYQVDLFESRSKIGGNADTVQVEHLGEKLSVDVGAEFFHPETHPLYWTLLEDLKAIGTGRANDVLISVPASLSIFDLRTQDPLFVSSRPLDSLIHAISFGIYAQKARSFLDDSPAWDTTIKEWVDSLWVANDFKTKVLLPWLASLTAGTMANLEKSSMLSTLLLFAKSFPENIFKKPYTYNSEIGLEGLLHLLLNRCKNISVHIDSPVTDLQETEEGWYIYTPKGRQGPYEKVIVNAPPHASVKFLQNVPARIPELLSRHEYFKARIVIHTDPIYMPKNKNHWSTQNAAVDGENCEGSIWIGGTRLEGDSAGKGINLFKSWATVRSVESKEIIAERTFLHPVDTPEMLRAIKDFQEWQGYNGLYFAGHFMTLTDLQETALFSAMKVAEELNPDSPHLVSLKTRLDANKRKMVDFDVH